VSLVGRLYLVVLVAVLPAVAIQLHNELTLRRDREAEVHGEALRLAQLAASELDGILIEARTLLLSLANAPAVRARDGPACDRFMTELGRELRRYTALGAADLSGRWFCAQGGVPPSGMDSAGRPWFEAAAAAGGFHVGEYARSRLTGRGVLPVTLPFRGPDGGVAGIVGLSVDLALLQERFAAQAMPVGASFGIADRGGTIVVGVPDAELVGQPMRERFRWMLDAQGPATLADTGPDGTDRVVGYVPPAATVDRALLVNVGLSSRTATAGVAEAGRRGMLLIALGVALALLAARVAGRAFVVRPIDALLRAAERWRAGDLKARVGLAGRRSEFGNLGAAFDAMAAALEAHEREIGRTLAALRASEERFRVAQEASPDSFAIFRAVRNSLGQITDFEWAYANARAAELMGTPAAELIGRRLLGPRPGQPEAEELFARYRRVVERGEPDEGELFHAADGAQGWSRDLAVRLGDGVAVWSSDITERKRTEAALRDSEERFRQFAENSHDLLWIFDRRLGRLDYLSPAFAEIWGRDRDQLLSGKVEFLSTVHADDRAAVAAALPEGLAGREVSVSYRVLRPDGTMRRVRDSGFPIRDASGEVIRVGGICRDITEWVAIEQERERNLEERELMLREINHRVKNNLQVVTSLLRLQASRSAKPEVREAFEEAVGRVSTITELHTSLFDGAQIGTLDFGAYLRELCGRLETALADARPAAVRIKVDAEPGPIDLDRAVPLGLIVNELVSNATRHGFRGDRGGTVEVGFRRRDGTYRLSVRDDGPGLAADGQAALAGGGLGMQLVGGFVRRIRGTLAIHGGPGFEAVVEFPVLSARQERERGAVSGGGGHPAPDAP
jgi:two-component system, sensor histidine kinase